MLAPLDQYSKRALLLRPTQPHAPTPRRRSFLGRIDCARLRSFLTPGRFMLAPLDQSAGCILLLRPTQPHVRFIRPKHRCILLLRPSAAPRALRSIKKRRRQLLPRR